jgi:peptidoglycan/LPS O-acetylase OafA/YrhL
MFPLDGPEWSLFCEMVINLIYARFIMKFSDKILYFVIAISSVLMIFVFVSNVIDGINYGLNTGGLSYQMLAGLIRCSFSFSMGVLLYRLSDRGLFSRFPRVSGLWLGFILFFSFCPEPVTLSWIYDLVCVMLVYPLIIIFGSREHLPSKLAPTAIWLGALSYPIYVLHLPLVDTLRHAGALNRIPIMFADTAIISFVDLISLAALVYFDMPCRHFLTKIFLSEARAR